MPAPHSTSPQQEAQDALRVARRLLGELLAVSPRKTLATVLLAAVLTALDGLHTILLLPLLGLVGINAPTASAPKVMEWVTAGFAAAGLTPTLGIVLALFIGLAGLRALVLRTQVWVNVSFREEVASRLRERLYRAIARAEWGFFVTRRPSEFVHVLNGEIGRVGAAAFQLLDMVFTAAVSLMYLTLAFQFSSSMSMVVLLCSGVLALWGGSQLRKARDLGSRVAGVRKTMHAAISEHLASMKTAKSYGAVERHADVFAGLSGDLRNASLEVASGEIGTQQNLEFASVILLASILYVSVDVLGLSAAEVLVMMYIFVRLVPRVLQSYRQLQSFWGVLPVLESVAGLERECVEAAETTVIEERDVEFNSLVRFENVSFTYPRRTIRPAIQELDLQILAGRTTAVVGPSGAGKTTLSDLFLGLLSPDSGRVLIDGKPLVAERLRGWRRHIGYVPQDTFLFHDTVRANLTWARPGATDDELWESLRLAAADDFVIGLPQGLDTIVGERGVLVSGGERQRLSLARALLRRPHVLVLDEATSSLDSETERRIQQAIEGLHRQMTIIIVTHRLSMISGADEIHVLDGGRLVESGTWESLLANQGGRFSDLCRAQGIYRRPVVAPLTGMAGATAATLR